MRCQMEYMSLFQNLKGEPAQNKLIIVGVNPIAGFLVENPQCIADMLKVNPNLHITIIYENITENFNQSLFYDKQYSLNKIDFEKLRGLRNRLLGTEKKRGGFIDSVVNCFEKSQHDEIKSRIKLLQNNLRHSVNLVYADDIIHYCITTLEIPSIDMYQTVTLTSNKDLYSQFENYINFLLNEKSGGLYLSEEGEELIQLYDNDNLPRGIYPRKAFYSAEYQRYSIWAFIFNRKGELLLHKRSEYTADNRSLWDKSAGGHVDLKDRSTILTAKREVVEELFMPEAEFTQYMTEKVRDFIDFGEWDIQKRPESYFKSDFEGLDSSDWVVFRPIDRETGYPMTIRRKSPRIMHVADLDDNGSKIPLLDENGDRVINAKGKVMYKEHIETWYTRFISDVYLMIAPEGCIDTEEQMCKLMSIAEARGAASAHKLIGIDDLIEDNTTFPAKYTDDVTYMLNEKRWLLTQFSEFIKYIFK